jgi:hypothetical protein
MARATIHYLRELSEEAGDRSLLAVIFPGFAGRGAVGKRLALFAVIRG